MPELRRRLPYKDGAYFVSSHGQLSIDANIAYNLYCRDIHRSLIVLSPFTAASSPL